MAQTGIIDVCTESINQPAVVCHANETAKGEHDEVSHVRVSALILTTK